MGLLRRAFPSYNYIYIKPDIELYIYKYICSSRTVSVQSGVVTVVLYCQLCLEKWKCTSAVAFVSAAFRHVANR